jgi:hypothetical protein
MFGAKAPSERISNSMPLVMEPISCVPARRIEQAGITTEWMFVDTWYVIGPFPNPDRKNINRKFPPETVVDLDAVYLGKDQRPLKWSFIQSGTPKVAPPNAEHFGVYYAFTEIYSDESRRVWIATGSDDRGNLWLNDRLIWISGALYRPWSPGMSYREIRLAKGINRLLYRVENAEGPVAFSLMIYLMKSNEDKAKKS